jgi:hypothetical protein
MVVEETREGNRITSEFTLTIDFLHEQPVRPLSLRLGHLVAPAQNLAGPLLPLWPLRDPAFPFSAFDYNGAFPVTAPGHLASHQDR